MNDVKEEAIEPAHISNNQTRRARKGRYAQGHLIQIDVRKGQ